MEGGGGAAVVAGAGAGAGALVLGVDGVEQAAKSRAATSSGKIVARTSFFNFIPPLIFLSPKAHFLISCPIISIIMLSETIGLPSNLSRSQSATSICASSCECSSSWSSPS